MSEKKFRLIASDLDGTLLQNGAQVVEPLSLELIEQVLDSGYHFAAASGRQYANLRNLFAPVADRIDYICENGCLVFAGGELVHQDVMELGLAHEVIAAIFAIPDVELMISGLNTSYLLPGHDAFIHHVRDVVGNNVTLVDDVYAIGEPYFKISFFTGDRLVDVTDLRAQLASRCQVVTGGNAWVDIMPAGVNKASAMAHLADILGITADAIVAFGDEENDIEMMRYVGCPVAMDNAITPLKEIAGRTTKTVDEALLRLLQDGDSAFADLERSVLG